MGNEICYVEFFSLDLDQSRRFFEQALGWSLAPSGEDYLVWNTDRGIGGGIRLARPGRAGMAASAVVYLEVADIESTLKAIEAAGGKTLHPKTMISGEHGYFAMFADPSGVCIGLWSKAQETADAHRE